MRDEEDDIEVEYDSFESESDVDNEEDLDEVVFEFEIMYNSFEHDDPGSDEKGWIMRRPDGSKYIRMTEFGKPYVANVSDLEEILSKYKKYVSATKKAIKLLSNEG